ncbi:TIGR03621 family F420-dependent LLM class oxidoreductase [Ktedonospora formicarum]|uniref:LLM class F420-dependent oxidoreductase n=1 Tax=Ktedonospora formicarum TaxID=2778364 RepID=A0A8J3I752_9CHLR|nr:TIGR03621 family F420-dependent LLM class oxidoreductase [Ktedonospora formicarum]GHO50789.1 LLM class F420-dependent oxidoreductase [Ktedonospora formicarum]
MPHVRPFRFGVITDGVPNREEWITRAREAEDLGYSTLLLPDHITNEFFPMASLMAAADATKTLRIGTLVYNNDLRHPVLLAKEVAALDMLSGGRFELGIGAGWNRPEYDQVGVPFERAGLRIERLEEALQILKQSFSDEPVNFTGKHYSVTNLNVTPKPIQRPHPPIVMGGGGKKLLSLAAREADGIGLHVKVNDNGTVDATENIEDTLAEKVEWIREAAGERFSSIELNMLLSGFALARNQQEAAEHYIRENELRDVTVEQVLANPYVMLGTTEHMVERIQRWRERLGVSYFVLRAEYRRAECIRAFAPVVAQLAGK